MEKEKKKKGKKILISLLAGVLALHTAEWFTIGKKVAQAAGIPEKEAMSKCLQSGILWWKPIKDGLVHKQPLD